METLDFKKDYVLEDERVLLRPLQLSDQESLLYYSVEEPDIWHYNSHGANGPGNLERYIAQALRQRERGVEYPFLVVDRSSGKSIGSTRFYNIRPERMTLELGYTWYGKAWQGTGINRRCKYLLLNFAFEQLEMERVGFAANSHNERSIRAMKGIGCTVEGLMRSTGADAAGQRIDSVVLSILKQEWEERLRMDLLHKINQH